MREMSNDHAPFSHRALDLNPDVAQIFNECRRRCLTGQEQNDKNKKKKSWHKVANLRGN